MISIILFSNLFSFLDFVLIFQYLKKKHNIINITNFEIAILYLCK